MLLQNRHRMLQRLAALSKKNNNKKIEKKMGMRFDDQYFKERVKQRLSVAR